MTYCNGKLVKATEHELLEYYLNNGMDRMMDFDEYLTIVENCGCQIIRPSAENICKACTIDFGGNDR